jgi:plastocyanin
MSYSRYVLAGLICLASFGCGSSYSPGSTPTSPDPSGGGGGAAGTPVSIVSGASVRTNTAYAPNPINVAVGGTVTWTNNDNTAHTSTADGGAWNSGTIAPGASFSRTFPAAGTFPYHCTIHPGMVGTVTVQ